MKTKGKILCCKVIACVLLQVLIFQCGFSQCTGMQQITYDTLVEGSGNDVYSFTFPEFDPSLGTLTAVGITAVVTINYGFTLQNVESTPRVFSLKVGRTDEVFSAALNTPFINDFEWSLGSYPLAPGASVTKPPYTILSHHVSSDSITDGLANFLGVGTVNFDYEPITYTDLKGSANYYFSANANDSTIFTLTYYYCNPLVLASQIKDFQASKKSLFVAEISWQGLEEQAGRAYEIQKSTDGIHFNAVGTVNGQESTQENYTYTYAVQSDENRKLYFRLRVINGDGSAVFSEVKMVDMTITGKGDYSLFPNPSDHYINISSNSGIGRNIQVEILSADGRSMQKNYFSSNQTVQVVFNRDLASGIYLAKITDMDSGQSKILPFAVK